MNGMWCFWLSLLIFCNYFATLRASVCTKRNFVTYLDQVYEPVKVPEKTLNWYGHYTTTFRTEYQWKTKVNYRFNTVDVCCTGYKGTPPNCEPDCGFTCPENSQCSEPYGMCRCRDGYYGYDCKPDCRNCGKNTHCKSPNKCECNTGYQRMNQDTNQDVDLTADCVPNCNQQCGAHSFCSSPDNCECEKGYKSVANSSNCEPDCSPSCGSNSYCKSPPHCECHAGYRLAPDNSGNCLPICVNNCGPHGSCIEPGKCECDEGYHLIDGQCQPICSAGCQEHSTCTAPEHCECDEGYSQRQQGVCEPSCPTGCSAFARCVSPNQCECFPGYELNSESVPSCEPKCNEGCANGHCIGPNQCACNPGYLMGPNSRCEPQCNPTCVHGNCSQPGICECEAGYRFSANSQHTCEPICEPSCQNGACLAPQTCICDMHHEPDTSAAALNVCKPSCQMDCVNGTCVSPDVCSCLPGYEPTVEGNSSICRPHCSAGCENGRCIAPETCVCLDGYEGGSNGCQLATTSTNATSDVADNLSEYCASSCSCWSEPTAKDVKCFSVCMDEFDQPCLNLTKCRCNKLTGELLCDVDSSEEQLRTFKCRIAGRAVTGPKANLTSNEAALNASKSQDSSGLKWSTILVWCVAVGVLMMLITSVVHFYQKHRLQQHADDLSNVSFENEL